MKTISVTNHKSVWEAKREFDLLTKRIITDKFRHHEFLLPAFKKKKKFQLSLVTYEKKKENPFESKCFITACAMACSVFLRWHDACPFNGLPKANHIRQFCYIYGL